jgi:hypothetical protein
LVFFSRLRPMPRPSGALRSSVKAKTSRINHPKISHPQT